MTELQVTLDFACCMCGDSVSVLVKCAGKGLAEQSKAVAAVNVPYPHCGSVNRLSFEPRGKVRDVALYRAPRMLPEPSAN